MDAELVERLNQPLNRPVPWMPWLAFQTVGTIAAAREQTRAGAARLVEHLHPRMPLHRYRGSERCQMRWLPLLGFAFLCQAAGVAEEMTPPAETGPVPWRADHHMHLASADICERVGDCLPDRDPPTVLAADAVRALDAGNVNKGVIFSSAYLYGLPSLGLDPEAITRLVRRENEFTAAEVARYPDRLIGFLSVDPQQDSALDELRHWQGSRELVGLKLHLTVSALHLQNRAERGKLAAVVREAANLDLPIVIHIGGGSFGAADAGIFVREILPEAGRSWVQVAHAGGGFPLTDNNHAEVLAVFADHITRDDPLTRRVLFDLSYVPAPEQGTDTVAALRREMRRIGLERFLFGSDYNVLTPAGQIAALARLDLADEEESILRTNCAPWVCPDGGESSEPEP